MPRNKTAVSPADIEMLVAGVLDDRKAAAIAKAMEHDPTAQQYYQQCLNGRSSTAAAKQRVMQKLGEEGIQVETSRPARLANLRPAFALAGLLLVGTLYLQQEFSTSTPHSTSKGMQFKGSNAFAAITIHPLQGPSRPLRQHDVVSAGDSLVFTVSGQGYFSAVSLQDNGALFNFLPGQPDAAIALPGSTASRQLPGSIAFDAYPGGELLVLVRTSTAAAFAELARNLKGLTPSAADEATLKARIAHHGLLELHLHRLEKISPSPGQ